MSAAASAAGPAPALSPLEALKKRSQLRKQLIAKSIGAKAEDLTSLLGPSSSVDPSKKPVCAGRSRSKQRANSNPFNIKNSDGVFVVAKQEEAKVDEEIDNKDTDGESMAGEKIVLDDYFKVLQEEEAIYRGSSTFLKGTQSANPHNDYSQHYVDSGQLPANYIRDPSIHERFAEYPKLKELILLKDELVSATATPPMYLKEDLQQFDLRQLGSRFDLIIIEPPLPEYNLPGVSAHKAWTWDMVEKLDIPSVADQRCFLWIWCGPSPQGTNRARQCLRKWGFRRCEDICWVKQNIRSPNKYQLEPGALFHRVKEHCLMGIKGTVRRSVDGDFIHANVDIDLIIEEDSAHGFKKPEEIFQLAERFCLGRRRLHLFARDDTLRPGWLSIGAELTSSNFDRRIYRGFFDKAPFLTTGCTEKIEQLRPKSPERGGPGKFTAGGPATSGANATKSNVAGGGRMMGLGNKGPNNNTGGQLPARNRPPLPNRGPAMTNDNRFPGARRMPEGVGVSRQASAASHSIRRARNTVIRKRNNNNGNGAATGVNAIGRNNNRPVPNRRAPPTAAMNFRARNRPNFNGKRNNMNVMRPKQPPPARHRNR